jgi:sugar phosphate isomerase/epimerase
MCELSVPVVNAISLEPDVSRSFDQFAALVEMAEAMGLQTTVEFAPIMTVKDIPMTLDLLRHVGRPSFRMLVDTLHVARSGATAKDVAALDPKIIGYVQLCDAPREATTAEYLHQASFQRMAPGAGELPLLDVLKALPRDVPIGLEIPMLKEAEAGESLHACLGRCVDGAKKLLARVAA